ncbi:MAG TPA: Gfo/Idh/MocA family oxidoreductase [Roseimicrobium sp.]|nr:Gfo/Idh/MocA family oxidoreductase [Roseimicrobium sp.]
MRRTLCILLLTVISTALSHAAELRLGMIGLDTSHAIAFTKVLNDPKAKDHVEGAKVVAAFKQASLDITNSTSRIDQYTTQLEKDFGVKLYDSIEDMCKDVDAVLIESVDGRPHLKQASAVIKAGKPVFIDKPMAGSLKDALEIFALAKKHKVAVFSASSLRFGKGTLAVRGGYIGRVTGATASSPAHLEPHHTDLFWYGIHGVESLFTVMGPGCETVTRKNSTEGSIEVEGRWADGRIGVFKEIKGYGGKAIGEKGEAEIGKYDGYAPLVVEIVKFFQTGISPVPEQETIEILAFMEADAQSKANEGKPVKIADVLKKAGWKPAKK